MHVWFREEEQEMLQQMKDLFGDEEKKQEATTPREKKGLKRLNAAAVLAHKKLLVMNGQAEGKQCKTCVHLVRKELSATYFKCNKFKNTAGPGTDWRVSWQACGLYEEDFCKGCGCHLTDCCCVKPKKEKPKKFSIKTFKTMCKHNNGSIPNTEGTGTMCVTCGEPTT